ncbi:MAG: phosphoribosylanthranilate isomerase, partial [Coriobacteriales bacterium]|nr:phosphoribosylanthranilate isomerase [Coriobacteriales bacterium]
MVKVKICGLTRIEDIEVVNAAQPDFIGFVFARSPRKISQPKALKLRQALVPDIKAVGVFQNEPLESISILAGEGVIDVIQLHGNEDESYIEKVKSMTGKPVIKAVSMIKPDDAKRW